MRLAEEAQIVAGIIPVDLQTAANPGDWVCMKNYKHCSIILFTAIGTGGDDPVITLDQATAVDGTGTKTLNISEIYHKTGATALSAVSGFTRVDQTAADGYDTVTIDGAENEQIIIIEVDSDDLDADNDFDCLQINVADVGGNAMLGCALYIMSEPRYTGADAVSD